MRSLVVVTILCLAATPAFAFVFDTEGPAATTCFQGAETTIPR